MSARAWRTILLCAVLLSWLVSQSAWGQQDPPRQIKTSSDLVNLGLQDLMNIEVTSVSRRSERLVDAAASIFVITSEEIRRSGVTSLPEALRLAPNLQVAQVSAYGYAISARGFNGSAANKLLVLVDGRSVYTPLFSGVFWDAQDVMLEDIERIEVISGPGGTLWGSNAVNGIINIITLSAGKTRGVLAAAGAGNRETNSALRYGGTSGADGDYRIYGKYFDRDHTSTVNGTAKDDASHKTQVGFRGDWVRTGDQFSVIGNAYRGTEGQPPPGMISVSGVKFTLGIVPLSGVNLLTRWKRLFEGGSDVSVQAYYDRTERTVPPTFSEKLDIIDVQVQHSLHLARVHAVGWGGEYRYSRDRVVNSPFVAFLPAHVNQTWASVFAQDEISLHKQLRLTLGTRVERNDYTGTEFLPNARMAWKFAENHLLWAAASRTVRVPSRLDRDTFVPGSPPFLLAGGPNVRSEIAKVYEIGYRAQPAAPISFSVTGFRAAYDHLRTQEVDPSRTFLFFGNGMRGTTSGLELWGTYQASRIWRVSGGYSNLRERLRLRPGSVDSAAVAAQEGRDPSHSWQLRSSLDLSRRTELDVTLRRVSALSNPPVPSYLATDLRFGWRPRGDVEVSITGQNLFGGHAEFANSLTRSEFGRAVYLKVLARFGDMHRDHE